MKNEFWRIVAAAARIWLLWFVTACITGVGCGPIRGRIVGVGRAPFPPIPGSRERLFRAEVDLVELPPFAARFVANVPAGTEIEADLRLAAKPIWQWLAEPIRAAAARL